MPHDQLGLFGSESVHYNCCLNIAVDCGPLRRPLNGLIFISGTSLGFSVTYSCNIRFDLIGDEERVCQSNGEWSGDEPICRESKSCYNK